MLRLVTPARGLLVLLLCVCAQAVGAQVLLQPTTATVSVHCPEGDRDAFVTPEQVRVRRGDSIQWQSAGTIVADSIQISLKDAGRAWPFSGAPARGARLARAMSAATPGTYSYNVRLVCRIPDQGVRVIVIDPDIIITP